MKITQKLTLDRSLYQWAELYADKYGMTIEETIEYALFTFREKYDEIDRDVAE